MRIRNFGLFFSIMIILATAISCTTLQSDRMLTTASSEHEELLQELAGTILPLDTDNNPTDRARARAQIAELTAMSVHDSVFEGRLLAWDGILLLHEGRSDEAARRLRTAESILPGDNTVQILKARLTADLALRLSGLETARRLTEERNELDIERALTLKKLQRYREAVAAFDAALPHLPVIYSIVYTPLRDKAWELRAVDPHSDGDTPTLVARERLDWQDAVSLIQGESSLFVFLTGGSSWQPQRILEALVTRGMVPPETRASDILPRYGAAWMLWHLNAVNQSRPDLLDIYSRRIAQQQNPRSPVADIPLEAPWFDAALGCIEWEIMTLPDGRNFFPSDPIRGSAFLQMIRRLQ